MITPQSMDGVESVRKLLVESKRFKNMSAKSRHISATPLHIAAESGGVEEMRKLLIQDEWKHVDVEIINSALRQPVETKLERFKNKINKALSLLSGYTKKLYADPVKIEALAKDPLRESQSRNKVRKELEHKDCSVDCTDSVGWTPLHYACAAGHLNTVTMLVSEFKADTTIKDGDGVTAIMLAALAGHESVVKTLLSQYHCPVDEKDDYGNEILAYAIAGGHTNLVKILINEHKADLKARYAEDSTPLQVAAYFGMYEVALTLINEFSCSINMMSGEYFLHSACVGGNVDLVRYLIVEHNAYLTITNLGNDTPLHIAALHGKKDVALALINEFGCDITITGGLSRSLLQSACIGGNLSLVRMLIHEYKVDINYRDDQNNTPLHLAALCGNDKIVLSLINAVTLVSKATRATHCCTLLV